MIVRPAEARDCEAVIDLARHAWPETPFPKDQKPDRAFMRGAFQAFIDRPDNLGLVLANSDDQPCGVLALTSFQHMFSGQWLASMLMWWIVPGARGNGLAMLAAAENWARHKGIDELHLPAHTESLARLCMLSHYVKFETTYRKVL